MGDRDAWTAALARVPGVSTPDQLAEAVIRLERDLTAAIGGGGESAAEAAAARATAAAERRRADDADAARAAAKSTEEEAIAALARAERKVNLLVREKESLDRIIKSYEDEDAAKGGGKDAGADAAAVSGATTASASGADPFLFGGGATPSASTPPRTPADARRAEMESSLRDARERVAALESEVAACTAAASSARSVAAEHARAAADASAALASATTRAESAEREAEALRARVGAGEFNPGTTKVLHLRANPESLANESAAERELAVVRGECEALRETVAQLHAAHAAAAAANTAGAGAGEAPPSEVPWGDAGEGRDAAGVRGGDARYVSVHARSRDRFRGDARRAGVRGDAGPVGGGGGAHGGEATRRRLGEARTAVHGDVQEADLELSRGGVPHLRV